MWKSIRNIGQAVKDMAVIAGKEVGYRASKVSSTTNNATGKLAAKAHDLREQYEVNLASRKDIIEGELIVVSKHQDSEA